MSVIPKSSPACDAVLAAVAGGGVTVPALVAATGRTRVAVNHAVARLRSRGLVSGTSRDGSLALTGAGRAALGGDTASAAKAGRRPTTAHLALALVDLGVATVAAMARATGMGEGTLRAAVRSLVVAGRLERDRGWSYRLTGPGAAVLAEYTRTWGPPAGLPDAETVRRAADDVSAARRRRTARGGRRRTDSPRRKPARRPVRRRAAAAGTTTAKPSRKPARVEPVEVERVARVARTAPAEIKRAARRAPVRLGPVPRRRPPFEAPTAPVLRGYASDHGLPANPAAARYAAARRRRTTAAPTASSKGVFS